MEETAFPRNVLVPLAGNDCRGLTTLSVGDMVQFHILQLVSSSTRDLDVRYNFKRAATCESNQHTWVKSSNGRFCMESGLLNYEPDSGRAAELLSWYNQKTHTCLESIPYQRRQLQEIQSEALISHMMVRVITLDAYSDRRINTKWKCGVTTTMIAKLLDNRRDVTSLLDCQGWQAMLKNALKNGDRVQISHVQSIVSNDGASFVSMVRTHSMTI